MFQCGENDILTIKDNEVIIDIGVFSTLTTVFACEESEKKADSRTKRTQVKKRTLLENIGSHTHTKKRSWCCNEKAVKFSFEKTKN